tara:strand:- start:1629 stop:2756 length:1128 start_codon:yes stop_codon:yes gene_type:complete
MATTFKTLTSNDVTTTRTLLHEAIPMTGSIVSGTYAASGNIKTYSHGMFASTYDYPYLSSSANHVFDISMGYSSNCTLSDSTNTQHTKKINLYNQMAQVLVGHDTTGSIREFDEDGNLAGGIKIRDAIFMNFARLLTKDEIKKGSFQLELGVSGGYNEDGTAFQKRIKITDLSGSSGYLTNSPAGEYGILYATASAGDQILAADQYYKVGLIYYQAGIAVLSGSKIFNDSTQTANPGILNPSITTGGAGTVSLTASHHTSGAVGYKSIQDTTINLMAASIRNRIYNLQFNNTTELNSTIYFCRANHNDFNYSSNATYLTGSKIRVKTSTTDSPVSYITTIGLYSADNELLAVAKLSEPLKKTPETELTLRVRLDY